MAFKEFFKTPQKQRGEITEKIKNKLSRRKEIVFAYVYGSFLEDPSFRDIDIGVYLDENLVKPKEFFRYQLNLGEALDIPAKYLVDIRILNEAPPSFLVTVFSRGKLLFSRNDQLLTDLIERASVEEVASEGLPEQAFRELIS